MKLTIKKMVKWQQRRTRVATQSWKRRLPRASRKGQPGRQDRH